MLWPSLAVIVVRSDVLGQFGLPTVTVFQKLLFIVQQLFVCLCGVLKVGTLNNRINWASLLAETTENALGHVDIVASGSARSIGPRLGLDCDGLGRADSLAKLAGDAPLFPTGVPPKCVLTTEPRRKGALFVRVVDRHFGSEKVLSCQREGPSKLCQEEDTGRALNNVDHRLRLPRWRRNRGRFFGDDIGIICSFVDGLERACKRTGRPSSARCSTRDGAQSTAGEHWRTQ
mmetsp:Transcript_580/g.768  ORF Transcript_580/g.768 Transcript_580/m.768 type:complete len:231 (+) Transcript_580:153-845(+)